MRLLTFLVVVYMAACVDGVTINDPPSDVVAKVGETVTLRCGIDGDIGDEILMWKSFAKVSKGEKIYVSSKPENTDTQKYEVSATYGLTVKDLMIADGGYYTCELASGDAHRADIIVINKPTVSFEPTSKTLEMGQTVLVSCISHFGSPVEGDLKTESTKIPKISLFIGGTKMNNNKLKRSSTKGKMSTVTSSGNYTAVSGDRDKDITCRVTTSSPDYMIETKDKLMVKYPVTNINYVPKKKEFQVGESLNCTADSNPPATFIWFPIKSLGGRRAIQSNALLITQPMIGDNTWECRATDDRANTIKVTAEFTVVAAADDDSGGDSQEVSTGPEAWKVAVGVVIPIVFICIIAIIIILYMMKKRRARQSSEEVKGGRHHPNGDSGYDESVPRDVPVTPNPTGYPSYPGPYGPEGGSQTDMPQSYPGRNSPGYADLGVRHLGQTNPGVDTNVAASPDPPAISHGYSNDTYDQSLRPLDTGSVV